MTPRILKSKFVILAATVCLLAIPVTSIVSPTTASAAFGNHFGRMFPTLSTFSYTDQEAADLAQTMENPNPDPPGTNNSTPDDSTSLAAWQTYFGQFLDHNLDFDNTNQPTAPVNVNSLVNSEAGTFNLHNLFGNGPFFSPQLYTADHKHLKIDCVLGTPFANGFPDVISGNANGACDLARNPDGTAITFDPRDDENQIISQMTVAWALFYNHFVDQGMGFLQAYFQTVGYYQLEIFDQMLPDFVTNASYWQQYATQISGTRTWRISTPAITGSTVPVEFSVGAYRFGHSLVRNSYTINDLQPNNANSPINNEDIFDLNAFQVGDLAGGAPLEGTAQQSAPGCQNPNQSKLLCTTASDHQIEWKYFFKALNKQGLDNGETNQARQTSPTISPALFNLPSEAIPGCTDTADPVCNGSASLVSRDLARGQYDGLPSGQDVAAALGCPVIPANTINPTSDAVFNTGTPLLYYVLAEAKQAKTVLGCTGSKIVAQEFLHALTGPFGHFYTEITPDPALTPFSGTNGNFTFQDLLIDDNLTPLSS
jgi:hypothetical protein